MGVQQLYPAHTFDTRDVLAARSFGGVTVKLLWERESNISTVAVHVARGGSFELVVEENVDARHVFNHPFAHAAWRGLLDTSATARVAA